MCHSNGTRTVSAERLFLSLLQRIAKRTPVVLMLDGITDCPELRSALPGRVLVVIGSRSETGSTPHSAIVLPALTAAQVSALLDHATPPLVPWRAELDALVRNETDGVPRDVVAVLDELGHEPVPATLRPTAAFDAARRAVPYKGLQVFSDDDTVRFHGRDRAVRQIITGLEERAFIAVVGSSGSGKSSVVRAGCAPILTERGAWLIVLTPGEDPLRTLGVAWCRTFGGDSDVLQERLRLDPTALARTPASGADVVLVIDQLEECFTLCTDDYGRDQFLRVVTHPVPGLRVLATLRGDYYGRASEHPELAEALSTGTILMTPPTHAELRRPSSKPLQSLHICGLEPGLSDLILAEVTDRPSSLPLLSHALRETWRRRRSRTLTIAEYHEAGRATGAIARTADAVFESLNPDEQAAAKRILLRLTALGGGLRGLPSPGSDQHPARGCGGREPTGLADTHGCPTRDSGHRR